MGIVRDDVEPHRLDVPWEEGAWIEVRELNWWQLEQARKARSREQVDEAKHYGAELIKAFSSGDTAKVRQVSQAMQYDVSQFDPTTLMRAAVVSWSYAPDLKQDNATTKLHAGTMTWLVGEIVRLSSPPTEADGKKAAAGSTPPSPV